MNLGTGASQKFKARQLVRYRGYDTGGSYVGGDILRIDRRRMGEFYDITIVASTIPRLVGQTGVLPPNVAEALPAGRPILSPAAYRKLGTPRLTSEAAEQ